MEERKNTSTNNSLVKVCFGILSAILPPVGYVLYLVWKKKKPTHSLACGWGSLIGCLLYLVLAIVLILVLKPGIK